MPALAKRLTSKDTFNAHPGSLQRAVFFDGLTRIFRTGWLEPARGRQKRRKKRLIQAYQIQNQKLHRKKHFATETTGLTESKTKPHAFT
jgi:hypothetical protein